MFLLNQQEQADASQQCVLELREIVLASQLDPSVHIGRRRDDEVAVTGQTYHRNRHVAYIRQESALSTRVDCLATLPSQLGTHPLTLPMMCLRSSHSTPEYRIKSSWGLLSPFVRSSWVVFLDIYQLVPYPCILTGLTHVMCDSMTRWTIGISPPPLPGLSPSAHAQGPLSGRGVEAWGVKGPSHMMRPRASVTHTLYTVISPISYGTCVGLVRKRISPR